MMGRECGGTQEAELILGDCISKPREQRTSHDKCTRTLRRLKTKSNTRTASIKQ